MFGLIDPRDGSLRERFERIEDCIGRAAIDHPDDLPLALRPSKGSGWPREWTELSGVVLVLERGSAEGRLRTLPSALGPRPVIGGGPLVELLAIHAERQATLEAAPERAVGRAVMRAATALKDALALPGQLRRLAVRNRDRLRLGLVDRRRARKHLARLIDTAPTERAATCREFCIDRTVRRLVRAVVLRDVARLLRVAEPRTSALAALLSHALAPNAAQAKLAAFRAFDAGELAAPALLLARECPHPAGAFTLSERRRAQEIRGLAALAPAPATDLRPRPFVRRAGRILYVAASARPWHVTGYTMRTAAVLRAMREAGADVVVATRPGYPGDRRDRLDAPIAPVTWQDGFEIHHLRDPADQLPPALRTAVAAEAIEGLVRRLGVRAIHAASDHVNALPALLAARRADLPFTYELRGLWELSRASRIDGFEGSERYRLGLELEGEVARAADRVLVISEPLAAHLRDVHGVDAERVSLLPNCVFDNEIAALPHETGNAVPVIGYLGSLVSYEGLEMLVDAAATLRDRGLAFRVRIVGDGESRAGLTARVAALGLADRVDLPGRVPPEIAPTELAGFDLVALPRLPHRVCEMVPPLKLVEAMAAGCPVVVPDLPVFLSEIGAAGAAHVFTSGDAGSLADTLEAALTDPDLRRRAAVAALERVRAARTWSRFADALAGTASAG